MDIKDKTFGGSVPLLIPAAQGWTPLPGGVLSFAGSGVEIRLSGDPSKPPYWLYDCDGRLALFGPRLDILKVIGEMFAKDRAEFSK